MACVHTCIHIQSVQVDKECTIDITQFTDMGIMHPKGPPLVVTWSYELCIKRKW